ncbi:hypothetical protein, partial [Cetobacterium sp.]|uniref:hypothetical protein n=1 Tax=Cetobacterium sp. TaxID=2071632 RepID=UPI002FC75E60
MDKKRELHTKEFMIHFSDIGKYEIEQICPTHAIYTLDTESSFKHDNGNIQPKIMNEKGKKIKNREFNFEVHVYAWGIANNINDFVIYGEHIDDMFLTFDNISKKRIELLKPPTTENSVKEYKEAMKFKVFVHNLAWDIEFCKYSLNRLGLKYKLSKIDEKSKKKILEKKINNTFQIIENDNIVYSANINLGNPKILKYTTKEKKTGNKLN